MIQFLSSIIQLAKLAFGTHNIIVLIFMHAGDPCEKAVAENVLPNCQGNGVSSPTEVYTQRSSSKKLHV